MLSIRQHVFMERDTKTELRAALGCGVRNTLHSYVIGI